MEICDNICECGIFSLDQTTPMNVELSGYYKRSYAYYAIKVRMRRIVNDLITNMIQEKEKIIKNYGEAAINELKVVMDKMIDLVYDIGMNKPIPMMESNELDALVYNKYLTELIITKGTSRFFTVTWLHAECFLYRQLKLFFQNTIRLQKYDYFQTRKQTSFLDNIQAAATLAGFLLPTLLQYTALIDIKTEFIILLKLNLWSNRCDLMGENVKNISLSDDPVSFIEDFQQHVLIDHSERIWYALLQGASQSEDRIVEFIADNAGYELFTDFCVADLLITFGIATKICFNIKPIPWFISDTTYNDIRWMLKTLINHKNRNLKKLGIRWNKYLREHTWIYKADQFWVLPSVFCQMPIEDPELYERLSQALFIFIKGDLNYRKLFGDINWEPSTPTVVALRGFRPTTFCILRTIKCEVVCGLDKAVATKLDKENANWKLSGDYGVIQISE